MTDRQDGLSVVIICLNEAGYIEGCLNALAEAVTGSHAPIELVLVDGGSDDDTLDAARRWAAGHSAGGLLRVVVAGSAGYSHQRNVGVRTARYPWVAFLSADVRVPPGWLPDVHAALNGSPDLVIGRFALVAPPPRRSGWMASLRGTVYPSRCDEPWVEACSTVHLVVPRERLLEHPFDERLDACEDKDLAHRLHASPGWRGGTVLSVRPRHLARESVARFLGKIYRESRALAVIANRHGPAFPDCFGWRAHSRRAIGLMGLGPIVGVALGCGLGAGSARVVLGILIVGAVAAYAGWHHAGWRGRRDLLTAPLAVLHIVTMWTVTAGWLAGNRRDHRRRSHPADPVRGRPPRSLHA